MYSYYSDTFIGIVFILLILFSCIITVMSITLILLRINSNFRLKSYEKFRENWEPKLFNYLGTDETADKLLGELSSKQISFFLHLIRSYLNLVRGRDLDRLSELIKTDLISNYIKHSLQSSLLRKKIEAIYFIGIFRNKEYKNDIAKFLDSNNDELFTHTARSLARINAIEYINKILDISIKHHELSQETIYAILIEFNSDCCAPLKNYLSNSNSESIKTIIIAVFTYFKYQLGAKMAMEYLLYSKNRELVVTCMKYFETIEYREAANALRFMFLKSSPEIISQAIKTASKIKNPELEKIIYERVFDFNWQNKIDAVNALYEMSGKSKERLHELSLNLDYPIEASIAKMVISERELTQL